MEYFWITFGKSKEDHLFLCPFSGLYFHFFQKKVVYGVYCQVMLYIMCWFIFFFKIKNTFIPVYWPETTVYIIHRYQYTNTYYIYTVYIKCVSKQFNLKICAHSEINIHFYNIYSKFTRKCALFIVKSMKYHWC